MAFAENMSYEDAVQEVFNEAGFDVLKSPKKFMSFLMDVCDMETPEYRVLELNCDEAFLSLFLEATEAGTEEAVDAARAKAMHLLTEWRQINADSAEKVCTGISDGLKHRLGLRDQKSNSTRTVESVVNHPDNEAKYEAELTPDKDRPAPEKHAQKSRIKQDDGKADEVAFSRPFAKADTISVDNGEGERKNVPASSAVQTTFPPKVHSDDGEEEAGFPKRKNDASPIGGAESDGNNGTGHKGRAKKIVLAITLVATFSAISYFVFTALVAPMLIPKYEVTYDGGGADEGAMDPELIREGDSLVVPECEFTKTGYAFLTWAVDGKHLEPGDSFEPEGDTTITAEWDKQKLTVSFDGGAEAEGSMEDVVCEYGDSITLPECGFKRKGYVFERWESESDGLLPGEEMEIVTDTTLTAVWIRNVDEAFTIESFHKGVAGEKDYFIALVIKNATKDSLCAKADFEFLDNDGNTVGALTRSSNVIMPGETTIIFGMSSLVASDKAVVATDGKYSLSVIEDTQSAKESRLQMVELKVKDKTYNTLSIGLKNTSNDDIHNLYLIAYASKDDSFYFTSKVIETIAAGEQVEVSLEGEGFTVLEPQVFLL